MPLGIHGVFRIQKNILNLFWERESESLSITMDSYAKTKPERVAVKEFRKYLGHYVNGFQHAKAWRARLMECEECPEFVACMNCLQQEEGLLQLAS